MYAPTPRETLRGKYRLNPLPASVVEHDPMVSFNIEECEKALLVALKHGLLKPSDLNGSKTIDFGCGRGVSTALLSHYGADVTGLEISKISVTQSKELPFVPHDKIVLCDGLEYMMSLPEGTVDISHALWLGPDMSGDLTRKFFLACAHCVKPGGAIIISSDPGTIDTVQKLNPLGSGFCEGNVFVAIRPVEMPSINESMRVHHRGVRIGSILDSIGPSRLEEIFRIFRDDGASFNFTGLPGDRGA